MWYRMHMSADGFGLLLASYSTLTPLQPLGYAVGPLLMWCSESLDVAVRGHHGASVCAPGMSQGGSWKGSRELGQVSFLSATIPRAQQDGLVD